MPRIARQVRHDVVVPRAGCRIDRDLGQRPTEASSGPVTPNRPEIGARDYADVGITLSDGKLEESARRAAYVLHPDRSHGRLRRPKWRICVRTDAG